jgi:dTDP-4-dehydrorhamnose reductase
MRILVLGARGQLGRDMTATAASAGHAVSGVDLPECDITDAGVVERAARAFGPELVINCAAYTAVDDCERNEDLAFRVNRDGAANAAAAAERVGAAFVHFSTDYVFDGESGRPYLETDRPNPLTVYGRSKLAGEEAVAAACARHRVLRPAWLYGREGANFVKTIIRNAVRCGREGKPLRVVNDQRGTPTWSVDLCRQTLALAGVEQFGVFHATSEGACTWFDFAARIVAAAGVKVEVQPCATNQFPRPARRPANSVLENARLKALGLNVMPPWEGSFDRFFGLHGAALMAEAGR